MFRVGIDIGGTFTDMLLVGDDGTTANGQRLHAKALKDLAVNEVIHVNLPGGGGYGDPFQRDPQKVLCEVIEGYVTPSEAEKNYGVAVAYRGDHKPLVKLPKDWLVDMVRMKELRGER